MIQSFLNLTPISKNCQRGNSVDDSKGNEEILVLNGLIG